jgi:aspartyl-tRNA(Asn)/glutamyl-tRNA(Gln) amidotransferase subunit A
MEALPRSIASLSAAFGEGSADPPWALAACRAEIEARNPRLNAIVHSDWEDAQRSAEASASRWRAGAPLSPLDGAPIVAKANCAVRGLPWTAALAPLRRQVAHEDSAVVRSLRDAGVVMVGVSNMHEAALGATTTSPLYGPCLNPLRDDFTPGGSSGGSAAAVAAGFCIGAVGTDTMGSVRVPSAYCGVVGFKPSFNRLSMRGVIPLSPTLDHVGLHANSVADVTTLFRACSGGGAGSQEERAMRVGIVRTAVDLEPAVAVAFDRAVAEIRAAGLRAVDLDWRAVNLAQMRRRGLLVCERELLDAMPQLLADPAQLSPELAAMLEWAARQPPEKVDDARRQIVEARKLAEEALEVADVLLTPTTPQVAFPHDAPAPENQADLTVIANLAGLPALCFPIGGGVLPASLQVLAPAGRDDRALMFAAFAETALR